MTDDATVVLSDGQLRLTLSPSVGGAISGFALIEAGVSRPILRQCHSVLQNVLEAACFPLVPYVNRIRGGRFSFRGREIRIAPNMPGDPSPLHGQGWLNPWRVEHGRGNDAVLTFHHEAGEWPWNYQATQQFSLDQHGLTAVIACSNLSSNPMPCGLGFHPYFPCSPATRLDTSVSSV